MSNPWLLYGCLNTLTEGHYNIIFTIIIIIIITKIKNIISQLIAVEFQY